jgi:DNA-binding IclR family transcriptional regulator
MAPEVHMGTTQAAPSAMIDRVASVLEVFEGRREVTLAQVCRRAGLPRSSAHRILQRLVEFGWVERTGFTYTLGIRMFELGAQVSRNNPLHQAASPFLADLHRATGLGVHLSALAGVDVVHLEQLAGRAGRSADFPPGTRSPAVHTAAGRAVLAAMPAEGRPPLEVAVPPTPFGIRTVAQLQREFARIAERGGIAVDAQGCVAGITVVAAVVGPDAADTRTALALSGPCDAVRVEKVAGLVRTAAMDIWCAANGIARLPNRPVRQVRVGEDGIAG